MSKLKKSLSAPPAKKPRKPAHPLKRNGQSWDRDVVMRIVCNGIATSSRGISSILAAGYQGNTLPDYSTIMDWLAAHPLLAEKYTRAKEAQAEYMAEEMLEIADDGRNDWMERLDGDAKPAAYVLNGEHVSRSKLRIESRKWLMGKLKPKKYGDKLALGGADDLPPIKSEQRVTLTPEEAYKSMLARPTK